MIKIRAAAALAVGAVAALSVGGVALAADGSDDTVVPMLPNGDVISTASPSPSAGDDFASPSPSASDDSASPSATRPSATRPSGAARAGMISVDAAEMIALRAAGGGHVESVERETEHGRAVWDVDVVNGGVEHDLDIDRGTGEITRHRTDGAKSSDDKSHGTSSDDSRRHGTDGPSSRGSHDDKSSDGHGRHGGDDD